MGVNDTPITMTNVPQPQQPITNTASPTTTTVASSTDAITEYVPPSGYIYGPLTAQEAIDAIQKERDVLRSQANDLFSLNIQLSQANNALRAAQLNLDQSNASLVQANTVLALSQAASEQMAADLLEELHHGPGSSSFTL